MKLPLRKIEAAWHTLAFVLLLGAFVPLWRQMIKGGADLVEGDPVQRAFLGIAYLGVLLLVFHPKQAAGRARSDALLCALLGWVLLSALWSVAPAVTLRRAFSAFIAALYGLMLAVRYPFRTVLQMLGAALGIVVLASLGAVLLVPEWGVMGRPHPGAWQGVLSHKNALGRTSVLALIVFWTLWRGDRGVKRFLWALLAAAATATVIGSKSATGLILALAIPAAWFSLRIWRRLPLPLRPAASSITLGVAVTGVAVLPSHLEAILGFFGKDLALTGRIPLWLALIPLAMQRPLLGYGYGAFWLGESGPSAMVWAQTWHAVHAHNGYLDLWLELGLIGALLAATMVLFVASRSARRLLRVKENHAIAFIFLYSTFLLLANITETMLLESQLGGAIYWIVFVYVNFMPRMKQNSC